MLCERYRLGMKVEILEKENVDVLPRVKEPRCSLGCKKKLASAFGEAADCSLPPDLQASVG